MKQTNLTNINNKNKYLSFITKKKKNPTSVVKLTLHKSCKISMGLGKVILKW